MGDNSTNWWLLGSPERLCAGLRWCLGLEVPAGLLAQSEAASLSWDLAEASEALWLGEGIEHSEPGTPTQAETVNTHPTFMYVHLCLAGTHLTFGQPPVPQTVF